jgi:hypothetical protein
MNGVLSEIKGILDCAGRLGLGGLQRLTKQALVKRFQAALETIAASLPTLERPPEPLGRPDGPRKFDLGQPPERPAEAEQIPWGYGQDRVTAMVVDPDRLYVYWEATDPAIARARESLGAGGASAWLNLRVYDVTNRIFDGTNAHGYFDHKVERSDRQWFFDIGKPGSTACVELGLKSFEGYFVRIARSGRADFPRRDPAPEGAVDWLTVRTSGGDGGQPPPFVAGGPDPEPPAPVEERFAGAVTIHRERGGVRVVHGPWQVVIRGVGGWAERKVLATWEIVQSREHPGGTASEAGPASERRSAGASEWRLGGASERLSVGASELRYLGASERALAPPRP